MRALKQKGVKKLAWFISGANASGDTEAAVEGGILGNFEPDQHKTSSDAKSLETFLLIAPDAATSACLAEAGAPPVDTAPWFTDDDAAFTRHRFDAATLEPYVAAPHSPANAHGVSHYAGTAIDVAYIGACTGAKLEDLRAAAQVLRGHKVASGVRLIVAPASLKDQD